MSFEIHVEKIVSDLYILRLDEEDVEYFEALWRIPEKITYNAYLLVGPEETILFDGWKSSYADDLIESIKKVVDPRDITHIIVHHMEPDHSGSLPRVLEENGFRAEVIGHPLTKSMIEAFYHIDPKFKPVRDGEELQLAGEGLKFILVPWLHWPETVATYLENRRTLITLDVFGGYSAPKAVFDEDEQIVEEYLRGVRRYVATVIGRYREFIIRNIEKLRSLGLEVEVIAPAHGIVWRNNPNRIMEYYLRLAEGSPESGKILVVYASMYGLSRHAIEFAVERLRSMGKRPVIYEFSDKIQASLTDIVGDAIDCEAILLGAPTYEADIFPMMRLVAEVLSRKIPEKPVLIIGSYAWGGVAGVKLAEIFKSAGFKSVEVVEFRGKPGEVVLRRIQEAVDVLASKIA